MKPWVLSAALLVGAIAWPTSRVRPKIQAKDLPFIELYQRVAGPRWIDRHAQARAESNLNPKVTAFDGGRGLGQFMDGTWAQWGKGRDPYDPEANADAQHRYMNYLEARVDGDYHAALGSYNAGLGSVRKAQRLASMTGLHGADAWLVALPQVTKANAKITQDYIKRNDLFRSELHAAFPGA